MRQKTPRGVQGARFVLYYVPHMNKRANRSGQTAVEYIIVFAFLLAVVFALQYFVRAAKNSAARTTTLVTCEYP